MPQPLPSPSTASTSSPRGLSAQDRARGRKYLYQFALLNAFSVACLMENILIVYAIRNGLSDPAVAVLSSFAHLTMPFMILGKSMAASRGLARTWSLCWTLRYFAALLLVGTPFLTAMGAPRFVGVMAILTGGFGLFLFRSMGMIAHTPLIGENSTEQDQGRAISGMTIRFSVVYLATTVGIVLVLRMHDTIRVLQGILFCGCVVGFFAAGVLRKIPESEIPRKSARRPIGSSIRQLWQTKRYRRLLASWCGFVCSIALIPPFALIILKNGYHLSDSSALLFSLLSIIGVSIASWISGNLSDHTGPRPLLVLFSTGMMLVSLFWAFAPQTLLPLVAGTAFFISGLCTGGMMVATSHYFLSSTTAEERVGLGMFFKMTTGLVGGLAGSMLGGGLLWLLHRRGLDGMSLYHGYFRVITIVMAGAVIATSRLEPLRDRSVKDVLGLLISAREIRTLFALNKLKHRKH